MTRSVMRNLCGGALLAAAVAGCADSPQARSILWWPQGPGDISDPMPLVPPPTARTAHASGGEAQAVRHGNLLYVSGQIADSPGPEMASKNDIEAQVRGAMDNVLRILESHGLTSNNIISVTLYLRELDDLQRADAVYTSYFRRGLPARSVVGVNTLPSGSLIQIAVVAGK
jgi:2-iminobutanoate/2-iminopropanoate deaminase